MKIGDIVRRRVSFGCGNENMVNDVVSSNGKVVYIHPKGRFHVVRFDFPAGSFTESYFGASDKVGDT